MNDFAKKQQWIKDLYKETGHIGRVEVCQWSTDPSEMLGTGGSMWNVYLTLFDTYTHYNDFIYLNNLPDIPLHGGVTYFKLSSNEQYAHKYDSVRIGCDYNHLHDEHHTFNFDDPSSVLADAQYLVDWVLNYDGGVE